MEVSSITLTQDVNSDHITVVDQAGVDASGMPIDTIMVAAGVTWAVDSAITITADASSMPGEAGFSFAYNLPFVAGAPPATFHATATYANANAARGSVAGPVLAVLVTFPPAPPPMVTALRYFSP